MKKLFTFLVLVALFASATFASKKCVYIVATDATADQIIISHLNANGYAVTVFVANGTVPQGDYELAVLSETIGSTANTWAAFRTATLPFVALKTFAARGHNNSLRWLATSNTGTDYANTNATQVNTSNDTHPIMSGVTTNPSILYQTVDDPNGVATALQWLNFPTLPDGATVLTTTTIGSGTSYSIEGQIPQTIAFERFTTMNNNTLLNRAVISGINFIANSQLTPDGLKIIKQACDWVSALGVNTSANQSVAENILSKSGSELRNPTNVEVQIYNILGARILQTNESSIQLDGLAKGVYIAKTNAGILKFSL